MHTRILQQLTLRLVRSLLASRGVSIHLKKDTCPERVTDGTLVAGKAPGRDTLGRFREIISDPVNLLIERVPMAGCVSGELVTLHNGLSVPITGKLAYYGDFSDILIINRGVHEPLEEFVFQTVLSLLPPDVKILELGAYWGHYSMWLKSVHKNARAYLVEPDPVNLRAGKANFERNDLEGCFINALVGDGQFTVDGFMKDRNLDKIDILHSDIQGAELEMLHGARETFLGGKVDYCFVSTHSEKLHKGCVDLLHDYGYRIDVNSGWDHHTTSSDGFIFACRGDIANAFETFKPLGRREIMTGKAAELVASIVEKSKSVSKH